MYNRIRIYLALIRKYGIRKFLTAAQEVYRKEDPYILSDCPECGTEHRIHKLRAAYGQITCKNCKAWFVIMNQSAEEAAFMKAFGGGE